jgi:hypothetical protein
VVFGSGGPSETTVATVSNAGNAQFNGTLQVGGTAQSSGTMTVRNNADAEIDYYLWPGMTSSQKGSFTYKDYNGNSQWYMVKDASNNWALNSATGGLDSFKAYQSTNSGDTYINASNTAGVVRVNYESGAGSSFNIYGGGSSNLYASFSGTSAIKFPGLSSASGHSCLQIDASGYISNTGAACSGGNGTVNSGSAGQIAFYNSSGTAVSGLSAVPVSAGGTGAATAIAALAALGGASLTTTAQQNFAGPVNASVNSQFNVMTYGARGDCASDDTVAFDAAQTAAIAAAPGSSPAGLYLPKPPGGCYIVSNWTYKGVPLIGQPSGLGPASPHSYNVKLKSKPGQDVLHVPDPTYTSGMITLNAGWTIRDVSLDVDASVSTAGMYPHRWPGRWFDIASVTNGSATLAGMNGVLSCGDAGQNILIGGAGATATATTLGSAITSATQRTVTLSNGYVSGTWPSIFMYLKVDSEIMLAEVQGVTNGAVTFTNVQRGQAGTTAASHASGATVAVLGNLATTVQSVAPCWTGPSNAYTTVTLAGAAQNTISNAHVYVSTLGLPVSTNVGNCGIAIDMEDGQSSDWVGTASGGNYPRLENVVFTQEGSNSNANACGIYSQGNPNLYGAIVDNFGVYSTTFGIVQQTTELNPALQPSSGDYEQWNHGLFFFPTYPWISSNGLSQRWTDVQMTALSGPQILFAPNQAYDAPTGWHVSNSGFECPNNCTAYGWHVQGSGHNFDGVSLSGTSVGQYAYWDANSSQVNIGGNNVYLNGYGNQGTAWQGSIIGGTWYNNTVSYNYLANPYGGWPASYNVSVGPYKGAYNMAGRFTGDFAFDGNGAVNYTRDDLIVWPTDVDTGANSYSTTVVADSSSPSGYYLNMITGYGWSNFKQFYARGITGQSIIIGTTLPTTGVTVYFGGKCLSGSSFQFTAGAFGGSINSANFNCTTSYQNYSLNVALKASDSGKFFNFSATNGTTFQAGYFVIVPFKGGYNGYTPQPADGSVVMNAATSWAFANASASIVDTNAPTPGGVVMNEGNNGYITSTGASSNLNGGALFPAVPSRVTYWVGAPAVFTNTLGAVLSNGASTMTLGSATTSAWPSSGYLMVDQEVMFYFGVSSGQTSISISRAQFGTIAQSHSNGAAVSSVGNAQLGIKCNGVVQTNINVYYASTYRTFSAPFPGQNCSGYSTQVAFLQYPGGPAGQQYNIAQIQIRPDEDQFATPTAANQVPISGGVGFGPPMYAFNGAMSLAGAGAGITTGPISGTTANHLATFAGTNGQLQDGGVGMPLAGISGSIGGAALTAGQCTSGTVAITGATPSMAVSVSPAAGISPGPGFVWQGYISSAGTVSVQVCAIAAGTPAGTTYNVRVIQ